MATKSASGAGNKKDKEQPSVLAGAMEGVGHATEAIQDMAPALGPSISMPSAKHFDAQLGIDVHLYETPIPGPLPTPHIAMVFDPFDYLPVVGGTVHVDGVKRGNAGTAGFVGHIPLGVFAPFLLAPEGPQLDNEIFMGSKTVLADGEPFSRTSLSVLDCSATGIVPPLRIKNVHVKMSPVLPTAQNVSVPSGVVVGGPPTINMMALMMKGAMHGAGKWFKKLRKGKKAHVEAPKKPKLDQPNKANLADLPANEHKAGVCKSDPVDIRHGCVDVEQQDFNVSGRLPLAWTRHYTSRRCDEAGLCGSGWRTPADVHLQFRDDGTVALVGPEIACFFSSLPEASGLEHVVKEWRDGARLFRQDGPTGSELFVRRGDRLYVFQAEAELRAGYYRCEGSLSLKRIEDMCGNAWRFERENGHLRRIVESGIDGHRGRALLVDTTRDGRIASIVLQDPDAGRAYPLVSYRYDTEGNLVAAADALDATRTFGYTGHYMTRHSDRTGQSFYYNYDKNWQVIRAWGDGGLHDYQFIYHHALRETEVIDSLGHVSLMRFDENRLPLCEIDPLGGVTRYKYDESGHTVEIIDPAGFSTCFEYDDNGNEVSVTLPDGSKTWVHYDKDSNPFEIVDAQGRTWKQEWDLRGLLISQTDPSNAISHYTWDTHGQLREHENALGAITRLAFDRNGHLATITNAIGHTENLEHDSRGCLLTRTDALDQHSTYAYDAKGRLQHVCKPDGATIAIDYDAEDRPIAYLDEKGERTRLQYAGTGKLTALTSADGHTTRYEYNTEEQLTGVVNQNGEIWRLSRDPLGRIIEELDYWGQATRYRYDTAGRLQARTDALGQVIAYETDQLGRITRKSLPDPERPNEYTHESFRYDRSGALIEMRNAHRRVLRSFDEMGRLIEETQDSFAVKYAYDKVGRCIERTTSAGNRIAQSFDLLGQLASMTLNDEAPVQIERDALGRTTKEQLGVGIARKFEYDAVGHLSAQSVTRDEAPLFNVGYQYDAASNLTHRRDSEMGLDAYRYDPVGRLLEHIDPAGGIKRLVTDAAGNHLRTNVRQTPRQLSAEDADKSNEWQREGVHAGQRYVFDAAGNLISRDPTSSGARKDSLHLRWDANHRLVESRCGDQVTQYAYDAAGRRVFKRNPSQTTWFFWDGDALLAEVKQDNGAADTLRESQQSLRYGITPAPSAGREALTLYQERLREYVYYPATFHPLAVIEGTSSDKAVYHYHTDPNGCPARLTDVHGAVVWAAGYDGWGAVGRLYQDEVEQPIRLQGQYLDLETGLHYNRHRYFDPNTGSFISHDPIGLLGGINPYQFAPNTLGWADPLGLVSCEVKKAYRDYRRQGFNALDAFNLAKHKVEVGSTVSQKQLRHIDPSVRREYRGGGYFQSVEEAQNVLDAYHAGNVTVLRTNQHGFPVIRYDDVTGTNVNLRNGITGEPTNIFMVKGTVSPSIVPMDPNWTPR